MKQAHLAIESAYGAKAALLPGDPKRVEIIKNYLSNVEELAFNREFKTIIGYYKDLPILATSTGIGGPSASIAIEELHNLGVDLMIRIGSAGALQNNINLGDLIVVEGAIRDEGTSKAYVDLSYPAVSDAKLVNIIISILDEYNWPYHQGIIHSHESFYIDDNQEIESGWSKKGILGSDLESAALLTVARLRNIKAASILNNVVIYGKNTADSISSYQAGADLTSKGEEREIIAALETIYRYQNN